jgi:hypothetical protein
MKIYKKDILKVEKLLNIKTNWLWSYFNIFFIIISYILI